MPILSFDVVKKQLASFLKPSVLGGKKPQQDATKSQEENPTGRLYLKGANGEKTYLSDLCKDPNPKAKLEWIKKRLDFLKEYRTLYQEFLKFQSLENNELRDVENVLSQSQVLRTRYLGAEWGHELLDMIFAKEGITPSLNSSSPEPPVLPISLSVS